MEKSFDLGSVLRKHQKKHKSKPSQFESVAGGVQRRIEKSLKLRKSSRLTSFDYIRNLSQSSPVPVTDANQKADKRRQQLQKWKEERLIQKNELAAKKIKPFITGVAHNPLKYVPPPSVKTLPSSSGCVTRAQAARNQKEEAKKAQVQSFAPTNAGFRAPKIKNITIVPKLEISKKRKDVPTVNFQPVVPATAAVKTRSRAYQRIVAEMKAKTGKTEEIKPKGRISKPVTKPHKVPKVIQSFSSSESESQILTSPSSSDIDLTARIISSSEGSNIQSSTESDASKSLQSSSSCEFVLEKESPVSQQESLNTSPHKIVTPHKLAQKSKGDEHILTPRNSVPKSESNSEERLRSPKSPTDVPMTPEQIAEEFKKISPCVTMSRGKDNARKEMKKKIEEGLLDEDASNMESVEHFQRQLASEIKRITEICDHWDKIYEQVSLPESVQGLVLGAVGQARLLMSQKMQQFAQLVQRCSRPEPGATLVTPADLRGFWDMVFIQVENVGMRFKELEELQARDWVEQKAAPVARKPKAIRPATNKPHVGAPSRLREMIAAARKAKAQESTQANSAPTESARDVVTPPEEKTFEAGFFCVRSPARTPRTTPGTPRDNQNLLKAVLSNEAEKASASKRSASFAMLRASVLGKNVEYDGIGLLPQSPLPQINLHATPGRSILKQAQEKAKKSAIKQIKVVLFNQSDDEMNTSTEDVNLSREKVAYVDMAKEQKDIDVISGLSPMDLDGKQHKQSTDKSNSKRKSKLTRQEAVAEITPIMVTRRMRKSRLTLDAEQDISQPEQRTPRPGKKTPKRSTRKSTTKVQSDLETTEMLEGEQETLQKTPPSEPRTLSGKKSSRSLRKTVLAEIEDMQMLQTEQELPQQKIPHSVKKTPKRSTRKKVTEIENNALKENYTPKRSTRSNKTEILDYVGL